MELVRKILFAVEASPYGRAEHDFKIDGYGKEQVGYHVHILGESGLLLVVDDTCLSTPGFEAIPVRLTWQGHEFLDAARDETLWKRAMVTIRDKCQSVSMSVLTKLLGSYAAEALGVG